MMDIIDLFFHYYLRQLQDSPRRAVYFLNYKTVCFRPAAYLWAVESVNIVSVLMP